MRRWERQQQWKKTLSKAVSSKKETVLMSGLTTLVKAVGNDVVLELEVTDIKQEVGEGKADECEV